MWFLQFAHILISLDKMSLTQFLCNFTHVYKNETIKHAAVTFALSLSKIFQSPFSLIHSLSLSTGTQGPKGPNLKACEFHKLLWTNFLKLHYLWIYKGEKCVKTQMWFNAQYIGLKKATSH